MRIWCGEWGGEGSFIEPVQPDWYKYLVNFNIIASYINNNGFIVDRIINESSISVKKYILILLWIRSGYKLFS